MEVRFASQSQAGQQIGLKCIRKQSRVRVQRPDARHDCGAVFWAKTVVSLAFRVPVGGGREFIAILLSGSPFLAFRDVIPTS